MQRGGTVYLLTNQWNAVLYLGVTSNLIARINQHRDKTKPNSFSAKYNCSKLIWYESFSRIEEAIDREKTIKKWRREWKENLINQMNSDWKDLFDTF